MLSDVDQDQPCSMLAALLSFSLVQPQTVACHLPNVRCCMPGTLVRALAPCLDVRERFAPVEEPLHCALLTGRHTGCSVVQKPSRVLCTVP